jgi:hypothetical protein
MIVIVKKLVVPDRCVDQERYCNQYERDDRFLMPKNIHSHDRTIFLFTLTVTCGGALAQTPRLTTSLSNDLIYFPSFSPRACPEEQ